MIVRKLLYRIRTGNDTDDETKVVLSVVKYNSEFKYQSEGNTRIRYSSL